MSGYPAMLLAALMLFARLMAPAMAMPSVGDPGIQIVICHAGTTGEVPGPTEHPSGHDCLLCPACHLASHAVLPMPTVPGLPPSAVSVIGIATPPPPATGPPSLVRTAAQPTGPPRLSA